MVAGGNATRKPVRSPRYFILSFWGSRRPEQEGPPPEQNS